MPVDYGDSAFIIWFRLGLAFARHERTTRDLLEPLQAGDAAAATSAHCAATLAEGRRAAALNPPHIGIINE